MRYALIPAPVSYLNQVSRELEAATAAGLITQHQRKQLWAATLRTAKGMPAVPTKPARRKHR